MKALKKSAAAKAIAAVLASVFLTLSVMGLFVFAVTAGAGAYTQGYDAVLDNLEQPCVRDAFWNIEAEFTREVRELYNNNDGDLSPEKLAENIDDFSEFCNYDFEIMVEDRYITEKVEKNGRVYEWDMQNMPTDYIYVYGQGWLFTTNEDEIHVRLIVDRRGPFEDDFAASWRAADFLWENKDIIPVITAASVIMSVVCFAFTLRAAGHRKGSDAVALSGFDRLPFDLLFVAAFIIIAVTMQPLSTLYYHNIANFRYEPDVSLRFAIVGSVLILLLQSVIVTVIITTATVRVKCRSFLRYNVITYALRLALRVVMAMPIIWRTLLASIACAVLSFSLCISAYSWTPFFILLFILWAAIIAVLSYNAYCLHRLRVAGRRIASGDLSYRVDTEGLHGDYRLHAEDLNSIGDGIKTAVEERMKGERFRAELITNVSHDIKTPLTSIINYIDLLKTPGIDEETSRSYIEVIDRQSQKLRRLTEDLIEASKASSGTLPVSLEPIGLALLLSQTTGEYEERLAQNGLTLITRTPPENVTVMADGRHTARIIDNLMSNVCKYALPQTRVYLEIKQSGDFAGISVSNISRDPLQKSAGELTERFVRGDESRHTDGSGLGLSIASSLAELQKGALSIETDADLFRATLWFNIVK